MQMELQCAEGFDTAVFSGKRADYRIMPDRLNGGWLVSDMREGAPDGADILLGVEWLEFADGLVDVETLDTTVTWIVDATGAGDFTDVGQAIRMALPGDHIEVRAGTYTGFIVDKAITIAGGPGVVVEGSFLEDNNIPQGATVDQWLQFATTFDGLSGDGILVAASGVRLRGLTIEGFRNGVRLAGGPVPIVDTVLEDLAIFNVVTGIANTPGSHGTCTSRIDGMRISRLYIAHACHGIEVLDPCNRGGLLRGLLVEDSSFEFILSKGIHAQLLEDSKLTGITMSDVGQFGGAGPFGDVGSCGNGIDLDLKQGSLAGIVIDGFEFNDVGLSYGSGVPHPGGGAIAVTARSDAACEGALLIRNGSIRGTSTGVRVGGHGLAGVAVVVENVTVTDQMASVDSGAFQDHAAPAGFIAAASVGAGGPAAK